MEACGLAIRRPPCGDFFFAQKLCQIYLFVTPKSAKLCLIRQGKLSVRKKVNFDIEVAAQIFCIQWSI